MATTLTVQRGDTWEKTLRLTQGGLPLDLTDAAQIWFTIRTRPARPSVDIDDTSAVIQLTLGNGITVASAANGELDFVLEPEETQLLTQSLYFFDVSLRLTDGRVKTPENCKGRLEVGWEATVST